MKGGQSVHHVLANNPDSFGVNEKTVYRYIAGGLLRAKNGDPALKLAPHFAPRARLDETLAARKPILAWSGPDVAPGAPSLSETGGS